MLATTIGDHGYPGALPIWLFVAGGSVGFCVLALLSRAHQRPPTNSRPSWGLAVFNLVPVAIIPTDYLATHWISCASWAFPLAGCLAVVLYVFFFSVFSALVD
jgi:hypothetical protein